MISVIIPSRNEKFLQRTIQDILEKAEGQVEIIAALDGYYPPAEEIVDDPRVIYVHSGKVIGMRACINNGVAVAKGEYILKLDGHCMVDKGFDLKLIEDCEDNWVVVPRRKRLDAENWRIQEVGKPDIDYMYLSYPDDPQDRGGAGLHGRLWDELNAKEDLKKDLIVDLMSFQGSAWFMKKKYFYELELMDEANYGEFGNEAQEIGLKAWLSGGRVVRNKKTFYVHLHKGKKYGRGYSLSESMVRKGNAYTNKWMNFKEAWHKQTKPIEWLIEKFAPVPGWEIKKTEEVKGEIIKSRIDLAKFFNEKGFKIGAEIGVADGRYSEILCQAMPNLTLYAVDLWKPYEHNWRSQNYQDGAYKKAKERLNKYNVMIVKKPSIEALSDVPDNLDFVFIDAGHTFDDVMTDIIIWAKKVRKGGIVAGHDYCFFTKSGVVEAVNKYTEIHKIELNLINRNPENHHNDDKQPCWWFVKNW